MSGRYFGALLVIAALVAGTPATGSGAAGTGNDWYYSGTLTVQLTASLHDQSDDCHTSALALIYENDKPANLTPKSQSSVTITFQEECVRKGASGTTTTYWFTADRSHLYDGKPALPIDPKKGVLQGTPVLTQPFSPDLSPSLLGPGKAAITNAYLPAFFAKAVTRVTTASGHVTTTVDVSQKTLFLSTPLDGVYTANRNKVIIQFHGDKTVKPYYFEDQAGTLRVTWNLGYHPL